MVNLLQLLTNVHIMVPHWLKGKGSSCNSIMCIINDKIMVTTFTVIVYGYLYMYMYNVCTALCKIFMYMYNVCIALC